MSHRTRKKARRAQQRVGTSCGGVGGGGKRAYRSKIGNSPRVQREDAPWYQGGIKEGDIKHEGAVTGSSCGKGDQLKLCRKMP